MPINKQTQERGVTKSKRTRTRISNMWKSWTEVGLLSAAISIVLLQVLDRSDGFDFEHLFAFTARKAEEKVDQFLSRCYGEYGCFSLGGKFISIARPVNLFPFTPEAIGTRLSLYTRRNSNRPFLLMANDVSNLNQTYFNTSMPSKIIVHGFLESGQHNWCLNMKDQLLIHDDYNVVIVDWAMGALLPYTQAVANARLVGAILGRFLELLQSYYDYRPQKCHMIGHSLGAHIAGYAGSRLNQLGRISGLDPAGPYFEGTDPIVRLDTSDAEFVDVIHTDGSTLLNKAFGMYHPTGHVDFYPNGGVKQPGCEDTVAEALEREDMNLYRGLRHWMACRHVRSHEYFTESINSWCSFRAYECNSYDEFLRGLCTSCGVDGKSCASMGFHADEDTSDISGTSVSLRFFLKTNANTPYCTNHRLVTLHTAKRLLKSDDEPLAGILLVQIEGEKQILEFAEMNTKEMKFEPEKTYSAVVSSRMSGPPTRLKLQLIEQQVGFTDQLARIFKPVPQVDIDSVEVENLESGEMTKFCTGVSFTLKSGSALTFRPSQKC